VWLNRLRETFPHVKLFDMSTKKVERNSTSPKTAKRLTPEQRQKKRSQAARKAAQARWSQDRPPSQKARKQQAARVPTSELTVEHYADRPNPELSWAAAILKRRASGKAQRREAARIVSQAFGKRESPWSKLPPEQRSEIARRGGVRRWEIWREERARMEGKQGSESSPGSGG
jgi:hypothetical protein